MPNIRIISELLSKKAQEELNEVPERIQDDIDALKLWLSKQPHIRSRSDDQFLVTFLRGSKYSLERAKEKLDMFYTIRTLLMDEIILDRNTNNAKTMEIIRLGVAVPLPLTEHDDGPRIVLVRPGIYDASKVTIQEVMKISTMMNDILLLEDDNMIIAGQTGILDLANVTMAHFMQFNPSFMKKMTMLGQEASPLRQKGFHYIHTPTGFETFFNMFKSFMSEKNQKRLHVHGDNMESLYNYVPKRLLPSEYGGEAGPIQNIIDEWEKKIVSYQKYFDDEINYGVDEKKRVGPTKSAESMFGVEGSFRKLNVD